MKRYLGILSIITFSAVSLTAETNSPTTGLGNIIIPEIDFREAAMSEIVGFLATNSAPAGMPLPKIVQYITGSNTTYILTWTGKEEKAYPLISAGPEITIKVSHVSVLELFKAITLLADGKIKIKSDKITIVTRNTQQPAKEPEPSLSSDH